MASLMLACDGCGRRGKPEAFILDAQGMDYCNICDIKVKIAEKNRKIAKDRKHVEDVYLTRIRGYEDEIVELEKELVVLEAEDHK